MAGVTNITLLRSVELNQSENDVFSYIIYSRCVGEQLGEVTKHQCAKEWSVFMTCVRNSAKKLGTKL